MSDFGVCLAFCLLACATWLMVNEPDVINPLLLAVYGIEVR